jgi:hypothetical protein
MGYIQIIFLRAYFELLDDGISNVTINKIL